MTSESELNAAAERYSCGHYASQTQRLADVANLLDWAIDRLASDEQREREDAEPITEEWLSSIDFTNQTMNGWSRLFDGDGSICEIFISHDGDVSICQDSDHVTLSMMPRIATRGQLRKLLEALKGGAS